jgi:hypothetical protein
VAELKKYDPALHAKPRWLVLNKLDMVPAERARGARQGLRARLRWKGPVFEISALAREGPAAADRAIYDHVSQQQRVAVIPEPDPRFDAEIPRTMSMSVLQGRATHRRQGRLEPGHQRGPRRRRRGHRQLVAPTGVLAAQGRELVMVSSGAIAEGMKRLGWTTRPKRCTNCRPLPPWGRWAWRRCTRPSCANTAWQRPGAADARRPGRPRALPECPLDAADAAVSCVIPVINENDTVVNDEIKFGDNDTLGALVANLVEADALVILTDQRGLYSADPRKDPDAASSTRRAGDPQLERMAGGAGSSIGKGGMLTKVLAAKRAARSGASTVIAWGASLTCCCAWPPARRSARRWWPAPPSWRRASSGWPTTCSCAAHQRGRWVRWQAA